MTYLTPINQQRSPQLSVKNFTPGSQFTKKHDEIKINDVSFSNKNSQLQNTKVFEKSTNSQYISNYQPFDNIQMSMRQQNLENQQLSPYISQQLQKQDNYIIHLEKRISNLEKKLIQQQQPDSCILTDVLDQQKQLFNYIDSKMQDIDIQKQFFLNINNRALNNKSKDKQNKYDLQLDQLYLQLNSFIQTTSTTLQQVQSQQQRLQQQAIENQQTLNKLKPVSQLTTQLLQNLAQFDVYQEQISFRLQKLENQQQRVITKLQESQIQ